MKLTLLFAAFCVAALVGWADETFTPERVAAYCREKSAQETQELRDSLKDVDVLLFEEPVAIENRTQTKGLITDRKVIQRWVDSIRVENDPSQAIISDVEGMKGKQILFLDSYCQCWGDFTVSAFRNGKLAIIFTAFHRKRIQSRSFIYDLSPESFTLLYKMAQDTIPDAIR